MNNVNKYEKCKQLYTSNMIDIINKYVKFILSINI